MALIVPTGRYITQIEVELTEVTTSEITAGMLITNGKVQIPNCIKQLGGGSILRNFWLFQTDNIPPGTTYPIGLDLLIFDNSDSLTAGSGSTFVFDTDTQLTNIQYHKLIDTTDWMTPPGAGGIYTRIDNIDMLCKTSDFESYSLYFALVAQETATFDHHTLTTRWEFEVSKTRETLQ